MNTYIYSLNKQKLFECVAENIEDADKAFELNTGLNLLDKKNWTIGCHILFNTTQGTNVK